MLLVAFSVYVWNNNISKYENIKIIEKKIKYPLVIKPTNGEQGKDVNVNINSREDVFNIINKLSKKYNRIVIEKYLSGDNYRILVYKNKIIGVLKLTKPYIIGDGKNTISQLINLTKNTFIKIIIINYSVKMD